MSSSTIKCAWRGAGLALLWLAGQAAATTALYRCVGLQGEPVYTSQVAMYHACKPLLAPELPTAASQLWRPARRREQLAPAALAARMLPAPRLTAPHRAPAPSGVLRGAVYRVRRADGSIEYTNLAPAAVAGGQVVRLFTYIVTCMACNLHSPIHWQTVPLRWLEFAGPIEDAGRRFGVDPALLRAVIHAESAFNPRAISLRGAQGLMQLMPATANEVGVADAFDASQNIHGGARYLARLLQQFHGDIRLTAAAYDAGAGAVLRYGGVPPFAETQVYVQRVELLFHRYHAGAALRAD